MSVAIVRALLTAAMACDAPAPIDTGVDLHWSPFENLGQIDLSLIASPRGTIDMAAFVLTDYAVITVLRDRASAWVRVRLLLDAGELRRNPSHPLRGLARHRNVEFKVKAPAVQCTLRPTRSTVRCCASGSANFSPSGLKHRDNALEIVRDRDKTQRFKMTFEALWHRSNNTSWRENERHT